MSEAKPYRPCRIQPCRKPSEPRGGESNVRLTAGQMIKLLPQISHQTAREFALTDNVTDEARADAEIAHAKAVFRELENRAKVRVVLVEARPLSPFMEQVELLRSRGYAAMCGEDGIA